jgi:hypothetical protein
MPTKSTQRLAATGSLAARLKALREHEFEKITQGDLARALGGTEPLSAAAISTWENPGSGRLPPEHRLAAYARLFCTSRSFSTQGPRLLAPQDLTEAERARETELQAELLALRELSRAGVAVPVTRQPGSASIWRVPPGDRISIVCSEARTPPQYASPDNLNFIRIARFGDLDTLLEVYGQVRADNADSAVHVMPSKWLRGEHVLNHIVIIGGAAANFAIPSLFHDSAVPIAQETEHDEHFLCEIGGEARTFTPTVEEDGTLTEDIGFFLHGPHPTLPSRRITIISGLTTRGVHGAALCFIDPSVKDFNESYVYANFSEQDTFCLLMRVRIVNLEPLPPNLSQPGTRLYQWSAQSGPQW